MEQLITTISSFIIANAAKILWILVLYFFGKVLLRKIVRRMIGLITKEDHSKSAKKRTETLGSVIITSGNIIIYLIILLMILELFGVDIRPILAGAGILGLAVGFGSQTLVKDFVSGLFILLENQFVVGDQVKIGSHTGEIIKMSMRSTVIKDDEGNHIFVSNNTIKDVTNFSRKS